MVFYGYTGQYSNSRTFESNEILFKEVLAEANLVRDLPCIILADLNCDPQHSETCRLACLKDGWTDSAVAAGKFNPTHYPRHGEPRRLDIAFVNKTATVALQQYELLDDCGFPNHLPIRITLHIPAFRTLYKQLVRPAQFSPEQLTRLPAKDEEKLFDDCWIDVVSQWSFCIQHSDVQGLWKAFNTLAESFLCRRASISDSKIYSGRGTFPKFILQPAVAVSRPIAHGGAQATVRERMLRKLARQIDFFSSQLPEALGIWPRHLSLLWDKITRRCQILKISLDINGLSTIKANALSEADGLARQNELKAVAHWRDKMKIDFSSSKRETYKWLSREYGCDQAFLKKVSTLTANASEIDPLVRAIWEPIMSRSPTEDIPSWSDFLHQFQEYIPDVPSFSLSGLTPDQVRFAINRMSRFSAAGLDNGSVSVVQSFPDPLLEKLCIVFDHIESSASWPDSFVCGYLCLIPKPESDGSPSSLRPLSILSVLYRAWASIRLSDLMTWQESWCHSSQSGFRKQHDTFDAWYPLALLVENSLLNTDSVHGVFLDYEKAFDLLPLHEIILPLARHLGLPDFFLSIAFLIFTAN